LVASENGEDSNAFPVENADQQAVTMLPGKMNTSHELPLRDNNESSEYRVLSKEATNSIHIAQHTQEWLPRRNLRTRVSVGTPRFQKSFLVPAEEIEVVKIAENQEKGDSASTSSKSEHLLSSRDNVAETPGVEFQSRHHTKPAVLTAICSVTQLPEAQTNDGTLQYSSDSSSSVTNTKVEHGAEIDTMMRKKPSLHVDVTDNVEIDEEDKTPPADNRSTGNNSAARSCSRSRAISELSLTDNDETGDEDEANGFQFADEVSPTNGKETHDDMRSLPPERVVDPDNLENSTKLRYWREGDDVATPGRRRSRFTSNTRKARSLLDQLQGSGKDETIEVPDYAEL
jgi:hypothetical protein